MELVDLLSERLAALERPACLMVDGLAPKVAHGVFGSLRNELWTLQSTAWVSAATVRRRGPLPGAARRCVLRAHRQPWPAGRCRRGEAAQRPRTRAHGRGDRPRDRSGEGNPRRLLRAATDIQAGIAPVNSSADEGAAGLGSRGPLAGAIVEYIVEHGSAAASDETLLRQIGASRQRASQLMHELESAGLLETIEQHEPGRRGRPPRRFALRIPA